MGYVNKITNLWLLLMYLIFVSKLFGSGRGSDLCQVILHICWSYPALGRLRQDSQNYFFYYSFHTLLGQWGWREAAIPCRNYNWQQNKQWVSKKESPVHQLLVSQIESKLLESLIPWFNCLPHFNIVILWGKCLCVTILISKLHRWLHQNFPFRISHCGKVPETLSLEWIPLAVTDRT